MIRNQARLKQMAEENTLNAMQKRIVDVGSMVFGEANMKSVDERMIRFMEEAGELVQAAGMTREMAHRMIDYAYDREKETEIHKEVGGVIITGMALADALGINAISATITEIQRVEEKADLCREKHRNKPQSVRAI